MSGAAPIADHLPEDIPTLYEGPAMELPANAEQLGDGGVRFTLAYPKVLKFRTGATVTEEPVDTLVFHRMDGAAARKIIAARDTSLAGFAAATRMTPARSNLIINALDAADGMAAARVVLELLGGADDGLPANAEASPDAVDLTLAFPVTDDEGTQYTSVRFPRMTVAQRNKAQAAPDVLDTVLGQALGITPKDAHDLLNRMDGADFRAVNRVVRFLFGLSR